MELDLEDPTLARLSEINKHFLDEVGTRKESDNKYVGNTNKVSHCLRKSLIMDI